MSDDHEARLLDDVMAAVDEFGSDRYEGHAGTGTRENVRLAVEIVLRYTAAKARGGMPCLRLPYPLADRDGAWWDCATMAYRYRMTTDQIAGGLCPACQARADLAAIIKEIEIPYADLVRTSGARHKWCRYAGPGRGDCEHFVGLPAVLDATTTDEYGIPHDWCDYCWQLQCIRTLVTERNAARRGLEAQSQIVHEMTHPSPREPWTTCAEISCANARLALVNSNVPYATDKAIR